MDYTKRTIKIFNNFAKKYQDKFMDFDLYHDTFNLFCKTVIKKNASILEIGCGPGNITKYLLSKRPNFNITGIDLSTKMIALAKINAPTATFNILDCRKINTLKTTYDAVMCGFAFPYLTKNEVFTLITDVSKLLNNNGVFYLSTMEDDYANSKLIFSSTEKSIGLFTYYHQADYIKKALLDNNFEIIKLQRKEYPEQKDGSTTDLIIIAKKNN